MKKNLDLIAANEVGDDKVFEKDDNALMVLSTFDEGPDLVLFYKYMMVLEGNPEFTLHFNASDELSASQKHYAETQLKLFKDWYANWDGKK